MYDKELNGILADEMGLGKTIQTISMLAHLACEKGIFQLLFECKKFNSNCLKQV